MNNRKNAAQWAVFFYAWQNLQLAFFELKFYIVNIRNKCSEVRAMDRVILHSDLNSFYATVECLHRPALRGKPVAVSGNAERRHGIILTRNQIAKQYGVRTGEAIWQAKEKCPGLITVPPDFPLYLRYSQMARQIYAGYTDRVEPFGIDECWLDVTGSTGLLGSGESIAKEINQRVKAELGVTVSIGVSFDKIYAKLGSDYRKPDAVTVFDRGNFKQRAWGLPVQDLLYVGPATKRKLRARGIHTIGQLANAGLPNLRATFGKIGDVLYTFANGLDMSPVARIGEVAPLKSIGNSCTAVRDLTCDEDVKMMVCVLSESVGARLREQGVCAQTVAVSVRGNDLASFERQCRLAKPTGLTAEIIAAAMGLFRANYRWERPVRSVGVRVTDFVNGAQPVQLDLYGDETRRVKRETVDRAVDGLRQRFGNGCVKRAAVLQDPVLTGFDPKTEHIIHPVGFF